MGTVVGTDNAGGNNISLSLAWPNTNAGDIAILFWSHSVTATRVTTPASAGFSNPLADRVDGSELLSYWEKTCTGSETGSVTFGMGGATRQTANLLVIRGYSSRNAGASNADTGSDANHTAPSVTPSVNGGSTVVASGERATSGSSSATAPSGYTIATQAAAVGSGGNYSQISYKGSGGTLATDGVSGTPISPGTWVHNVAAANVSMFTLHFAPATVSITVADATSAHTAESPALSQVHAITPADGAHAQAADSPALTQVHEVAPASAEHGHAAGSPTLSVTYVIAPDVATHVHAATEPTVDVNVAVSVDGAEHDHTASSPILTQVHVIAPADAASSQAADSPAITQLHLVTVDDSGHEHAAGSPVVAQVHVVLPAATLHAQATGSPAVTTGIAIPGRAAVVEARPAAAALVFPASSRASITTAPAPRAQITEE